MTRLVPYVVAVTVGTLAATGVASAAESADKEHAELAKALRAAKVSLRSGLSAAATLGKPISAKFEVEDGKLLLSVYTEKDGKFSEVVVDDVTGKVAKSEPITEGEHLAAAKVETEAMAKSRVKLADAVGKAEAASKGFRAVSVVPSLKDGHPVAEVLLFNGEWKTVVEALD